MNQPRTHYDNLQISRNASDTVIRAAYKALSQKFHPDKNQDELRKSEARMKIINEAYWVLSDPVRKAKHDEWIQCKEEELIAAKSKSKEEEIEKTSATPEDFGANSRNYFTQKESKEKSDSEIKPNPAPNASDQPKKESSNPIAIVAFILFFGFVILGMITPKSGQPTVQSTTAYAVSPQPAESHNFATPDYVPFNTQPTVATQVNPNPTPSPSPPARALNNLRQLPDSERAVVASACENYQPNQSSRGYRECISEQIDILPPTNDRVDVTLIKQADQATADSICSSNKFVTDPVSFRNCIKNHAIRLLNNPNYERAIN